MPVELCACGQPLHYADASLQSVIAKSVLRLGPTMTVFIGARAWQVPRHYIALHGLKESDLERMQFPEIPYGR